MQDEQELNQSNELYSTLIDYVETLKESPIVEDQIDGILNLLKSTFEIMGAADMVRFQQQEMLGAINESVQSHVKVITEHEERINKLVDITEKIVSTSKELAEQTKSSVESTSKNTNTLVEKINEQANEINENAAAIKEIKDSLKL